MKRTLLACMAGFAMSTTALAVEKEIVIDKFACKAPPCGLAVGQHPDLLDRTQRSNAGIGNGGELGGKKAVSESRDWDPGNSGAHNQAADDDPICELIKECLEVK